MSPGYERPLFLLAFDHRTSFERMLGIGGRDDPNRLPRLLGAKALIFRGFERAVREGVPRETAGILVDEQYGADIARRARERGYIFAMPFERSGRTEFEFEHGDEFAAAIERFNPTFTKALVRFNPEGNRQVNRRQLARLRRLSDWLHEHGRLFMFELLVPSQPHQLGRVGGDPGRYDRELRPELMLQAIREVQEAEIEPDVWKLEGLEDREACRRIAEQARSGRRQGVSCIVLGRGASITAVERWLRAAAGVPGFIGFAIGRSIFADALACGEDGAATIARNYRHFVDVYRAAEDHARSSCFPARDSPAGCCENRGEIVG
jgi:myo-inositol catabolism protein IolC